VVIGSPGAGKSVFAERLGRLLGIEVFHLDALYWRSGSPPSAAEWAELEEDVVRRDRWVADGNYSATLTVRLDAADTAVFLDLPRLVCLARFARRRFRSQTAADMPPDRRAYLSWSAVRGIVSFPRDHRPGFLDVLKAREDRLRVVVLRAPSEVETFLEDVAQELH
jgi:adenylate kinase family enzyme